MSIIEISEKASEDLKAIAKHGRDLFGIAQARLYHAELKKLFELIAENPHMARERHELSTPVRAHRHKSHLILYRIKDDNGILIIRICHGHEDWSGGASKD